MFVARASLVDLDDDEASRQSGSANEVEQEVGDCASALLLGCMRGLKDESCLYGKQEAGLYHRLSMIRLPRRVF